MKRFPIIIALLSVTTLAAPAAKDTPLAPKEMESARKTYVGKCAKCHRFYDPKDYAETDWRKWLDAMERKAKLKAQDADALRRYLASYRAGELPGKPQDKPPAK